MNVNEIANSIKTGWIVATSSLGTSMAYLMALIPEDIGKLGALMAAILSGVLIYLNTLKIQLIKKQLKEDD